MVQEDAKAVDKMHQRTLWMNSQTNTELRLKRETGRSPELRSLLRAGTSPWGPHSSRIKVPGVQGYNS